MKQLKTIKLRTGGVDKNYVQVSERVLAFNEAYPNGMITTKPTFNEKTVYFIAEIIPDVKNKERFFVGHSFGELGREKALEKLETVAVGRALAFMGIGIVEGIASADEINKFQNKADSSTEKPGVCDICGSVAIKAQTKQGRVFQTCPEWKNHQAEKEKFKIIQPKEPLDPSLQKFSDDLDNIK